MTKDIQNMKVHYCADEEKLMANTQRVLDEIFKPRTFPTVNKNPSKHLAEIELDCCEFDHRGEKKHFMWMVLEVYGKRDGDGITIDYVETSDGDDITDSLSYDDMGRILQYVRENG